VSKPGAVDWREENLRRCEESLRLETRADGRVFIVIGDHWIPRKFVWRVVSEYSGMSSECLFVEGVGGTVHIAELPGTPDNVARLRALATRIIELWTGE
jgi:hypothetical protein